MQEKDKYYFELLKSLIVGTMQATYPGINSSISDWKGQEIIDFQEELLLRVNAHISEKWFYTHIKTGHTSLPRVDVLNLLCRYTGYANWDDFVFKNTQQNPVEITIKSHNRMFLVVPLITAGVLCLFLGLFWFFNTQEYTFSFYDADTKEPILRQKVEMRLLMDGESPVDYLTDPDGHLQLKTDKTKIRMVVKAPYYKTDTITRILKKFKHNESISLHANDYALMIHYFSNMDIKDWHKRRNDLDKMIDDTAMIYQVHDKKDAIGLELFNKPEFVDKLTMPSGSLKAIEVLDTKYRKDKIVMLRFRVKEN